MFRHVQAIALAVVCAVPLAAQDTSVTTKTKVNSDDGKVMTYTGCIRSVAETKSFVLEKVPVSSTTTSETAVGTSGTPTTTTTTKTTYALVPTEKIDLQPSVGQQVEITGVLIPAGDDTTEIETQTETEVHRENAPNPQTEEKTEVKVPQGPTPKLKVVSVKSLGQPCM
jgi:hypothetical protein